MSSSNCCFLTCIQISQEAGQVVWYSHLLKNFPQFVVVHTDKGFDIVNKAEVDIFLELLLFRWASRCWRFDLWFLCFFQIQLEHLEVHGSLTVEAWLGEYEQSISDAISVYKGCCGHWVISYCRCPRMCTLRGFRMKSNRYWPWIVKVHIKGVVSMSPDSSIFSFVESSNLRMFAFSLVNLNLLVFQPLGFCCKNFCISWLLYASEQSLRATWEAISQA